MNTDTTKKVQAAEVTFADDAFSPLPEGALDQDQIARKKTTYFKDVWRNFKKNKPAVISLVVIAVMIFFVLFGPMMTKFDYYSNDYSCSNQGPNAVHWFGTDNLGRDYWCQVWYAAQVSIKLALIVAAGECVIGVIIGCIWGYVRSLDRIFTEIYNVINNIPIIIYMTLAALVFGQSFRNMALAMIAFGWLVMARNVRNLVLMYRDREYNLASRCLGTPVWRILLKNIFPYLISVVILRLALSIPQTIALESTLSYLGLGLDVNTPSLGILLRNARNYFLQYPYLLVFPAVIVSLITITFYLVGNAFSDAADPRNHV